MACINKKPLLKVICFLFLVFSPFHASQASVVLMGNRVIYPAAAKEKLLEFKNNGDMPMLVQIWLDRGNPDLSADKADAPFVALPQIFRINPHSGQAVRLMFTGNGLPQDRESVFYLNFTQYPSLNKNDSNKNRLSIIVKSRLKVFYRPGSIAGEANDALNHLLVNKMGNRLQVKNPTPYFASLLSATVSGGGHQVNIKNVDMIPPLSDVQWTLSSGSGNQIKIDAINDYGANISRTIAIP